jgi:hypothetical protein
LKTWWPGTVSHCIRHFCPSGSKTSTCTHECVSEARLASGGDSAQCRRWTPLSTHTYPPLNAADSTRFQRPGSMMPRPAYSGRDPVTAVNSLVTSTSTWWAVCELQMLGSQTRWASRPGPEQHADLAGLDVVAFHRSPPTGHSRVAELRSDSSSSGWSRGPTRSTCPQGGDTNCGLGGYKSDVVGIADLFVLNYESSEELWVSCGSGSLPSE